MVRYLKMINEERVTRNDWPFAGAPEEQNSLPPTITSFPRTADRNQEKTRLRYLRARRMASQDDDGGVWGEDSFFAEPSADEIIPPDHSVSRLPSREHRRCTSQAAIRA